MNNNETFITAIYKNAQTAMGSINNLMKKVTAEKLKKEFSNELNLYSEILSHCEEVSNQLGLKMKDLGCWEKAKMWCNINMSTMFDKSCRNLASITIFGTTMGIIDMIEVTSDCAKCNKEVMEIAKKLLEYEELCVENLKPFLAAKYNKKKEQPKQDAEDSQSEKED